MHLAPRQEQSGSKTRKARAQGMNRAGQLFRQAAQSWRTARHGVGCLLSPAGRQSMDHGWQ
ncbi:MAG: hypothetical protein IPP94_11580 [Ignavibacteria bacterium]|nr:hypothetical protein [Ignavibacteria bacterium]